MSAELFNGLLAEKTSAGVALYDAALSNWKPVRGHVADVHDDSIKVYD